MLKRSHIRRLVARTLAGGVAALALTTQVHAQVANGPNDRCAQVVGAFPQSAPFPGTPAAGAPNIVVVLVDDMGFSDIGLFGSEIQTPNIDQIGQSGVVFNQFYNTARCSPSRASLLTGLYPHQAGLGYLQDTPSNKANPTQSRGLCEQLLPRGATMAEVLRKAGYFTAMAGKWHIGQPTTQATASKRGFQRSIVIPSDTYYPNQTVQGEENNLKAYIDGTTYDIEDPIVRDTLPTGAPWYATDLLEHWSEKYVDEAASANKPFFLYLSFTAPHFPLMAPESDVNEQMATYRNSGWDTLRSLRYGRQVAANGVLGPNTTTGGLADKSLRAMSWQRVVNDGRYVDRFANQMAVYAAAVKHVDTSVGKLMNYLQARGVRDNTLVVFMSDNGGNAEGGADGRYNGVSGSVRPGGPNSEIYTGLNWSHLQNAPFRSFKRLVDEGGIATPLLMSWPAGMRKPGAPAAGTIVTTPTHLIDIMPTMVAAAKTSYPSAYRGHAILPAEGMSLLPVFSGNLLGNARTKRNGMIFWEHEGNRAVRDGKWKAIAQCNAGSWELYDMSVDRTEKNNVAGSNPGIVANMTAAYTNWASQTYVDNWLTYGNCFTPPASALLP